MAKLLLTGQRQQFGKLSVCGYTKPVKNKPLDSMKKREEHLAEIRKTHPAADYGPPKKLLFNRGLVMSDLVLHNDWRPATPAEQAAYDKRRKAAADKLAADKKRVEARRQRQADQRLKRLQSEAKALGFDLVKKTTTAPAATE